MRNRSKLLLAALSAIALLGMAVGVASARNLEVSNSEAGFRIIWSDLKLEAAGREADCPVTLEGTFERRTFSKLATTNVGRVTEAAVGTCIRGRATVLRETLPWEVRYSSFAGTLPNISSVNLNLIRASFRVNIEGIECLARTEANQPARGNAIVSGGEIRTFEAERNAGITTTGGFFCSISGAAHFSGNGTATTREGAATTRIRLI
ncbi:MAG TPA: hypothetical protein VN635_10925 [Conexibacter sp.]|nr:hypothetical protein [Conexibacter sp.]